MERTRKINILLYITVAIYLAVTLCLKVFQIQLPVMLGLGLGQILVIVPTILYFVIQRTNPLQLIRFRGLKPSVVFLVILVAFLLIPVVTFINSISLLFVENEVAPVMTTLNSLPFGLGLLFIAIFPAVVEEFTFRGVYYHTYLQNGIWKGIFLSAFIFGLMHMNINQFSYAFVLGIFLALIVEATGSIFSAMLVHFIINGNSYVLSYLVSHMQTGASTSVDMIEMADMTVLPFYMLTVLFLFVVASVCLFLLYLLYKQIAKISGRELYFNALCHRKIRPPYIEPTVDIYLGLAILLCIVEMIWF